LRANNPENISGCVRLRLAHFEVQLYKLEIIPVAITVLFGVDKMGRLMAVWPMCCLKLLPVLLLQARVKAIFLF